MKNIYAFLIAILFFSGSSIGQTQDAQSEQDKQRRIIERHYDDVSDSARWEIKARYPELRLKGDTAAKEFNNAAKSLVMKEVAGFKKRMASFTKEDREFLPKGMNYYFDIGYTVAYADEDLISIYFGKSTYTGGAHPNHWGMTLNFDLYSKKVLILKDLFKPGSDYLKLISAESIKQIKKKQGKFYAEDWVMGGAGEKLENFKTWNITKKGLKFTFDPYQVGSYAEGFYETLIPFERFPSAVRGDGFYKVSMASYIDGNPPNWCRNGHFPKYGEFKVATVKGRKNSRAYFYSDDDTCPDGSNCRKKAYVIAGDKLIVSRKYGNYVCSWFEPKKGNETAGWIKADRLEIRNSKPVNARAWVGEWEDGESSIRIISGNSVDTFLVKGNSFWRGLGDNIHIGELDYPGHIKNGVLKTASGDDKYACKVEMRMVGNLLVVSDNSNCGGVNVSFTGVYKKK